MNSQDVGSRADECKNKKISEEITAAWLPLCTTLYTTHTRNSYPGLAPGAYFPHVSRHVAEGLTRSPARVV